MGSNSNKLKSHGDCGHTDANEAWNNSTKRDITAENIDMHVYVCIYLHVYIYSHMSRCIYL